MIIELKRDKARKAAIYKSLPAKGFGEGVGMWALTTDATLMVKTLDKITAQKSLSRYWQQYEM